MVTLANLGEDGRRRAVQDIATAIDGTVDWKKVPAAGDDRVNIEAIQKYLVQNEWATEKKVERQFGMSTATFIENPRKDSIYAIVALNHLTPEARTAVEDELTARKKLFSK